MRSFEGNQIVFAAIYCSSCALRKGDPLHFAISSAEPQIVQSIYIRQTDLETASQHGFTNWRSQDVQCLTTIPISRLACVRLLPFLALITGLRFLVFALAFN